jgi:hypothetical protein
MITSHCSARLGLLPRSEPSDAEINGCIIQVISGYVFTVVRFQYIRWYQLTLLL